MNINGHVSRKNTVLLLVIGMTISAVISSYVREYRNERKVPASLNSAPIGSIFCQWLSKKHPADTAKLNKAWSNYGMEWILEPIKGEKDTEKIK